MTFLNCFVTVAPASNHPVPVGQTTSGQQMYSPSKSTTYTGGYQSNLSHSPSVLPPVTQTLPPTQPQQQQPQTTSQAQAPSSESSSTTTTTTTTATSTSSTTEITNKPQSNGTAEKPPPPPKSTTTEQNHVVVIPSATVVNKEKPQILEKNIPTAAAEKIEVKEKIVEVQQQQKSVAAATTTTNITSTNTSVAQEQQNKVVVGAQVVATSPQLAKSPKEQVRKLILANRTFSLHTLNTTVWSHLLFITSTLLIFRNSRYEFITKIIFYF